jgi:hypothetical protein
MEIIIHRDGENFGPYTTNQIKEYLKDGTLIDTDLAWHNGCNEWVPLRNAIALLKSLYPAGVP